MDLETGGDAYAIFRVHYEWRKLVCSKDYSMTFSAFVTHSCVGGRCGTHIFPTKSSSLHVLCMLTSSRRTRRPARLIIIGNQSSQQMRLLLEVWLWALPDVAAESGSMKRCGVLLSLSTKADRRLAGWSIRVANEAVLSCNHSEY